MTSLPVNKDQKLIWVLKDNRHVFTNQTKEKFKYLFGEKLYAQTFISDSFDATFES